MQGSVLFNNYGFKSNEELLLSYGFMLPGNLADFFHITLSLGARPAAAPGPGQGRSLLIHYHAHGSLIRQSVLTKADTTLYVPINVHRSSRS